MRPSSPPPAALLAVLLVAVFAVLFADILAVSATADPMPASVGAVLTPISPSSISRPYSHSSFRISSHYYNNIRPHPRLQTHRATLNCLLSPGTSVQDVPRHNKTEGGVCGFRTCVSCDGSLVSRGMGLMSG